MKILLSTITLILALEAGLRLTTGMPNGIFLNMMPGSESLYPSGKSISRIWGAIPYTIKTNNLGFRGNFDISPKKDPDTLRVATIGDSITDGFFVDNVDTYPHQLHLFLNQSVKAEVVNAAKGGGSINKQIAIQKQYVDVLKPDLVILTFVSNDINEIEGLNQQELIEYQLPTDTNNPVNWLISHTALGEASLDLFMRTTKKKYSTASISDLGKTDRYNIKNNSDFIKNAEYFHSLSIKWANRVLTSPHTDETTTLIQNYLFALDHLHQHLKKQGIRLLFVYQPSYSQVYLDDITMEIRDILEHHSKQNNIHFLDLTPSYKQHAFSTPLHLAPIDFHPNPNGNKLIAETIGNHILENLQTDIENNL